MTRQPRVLVVDDDDTLAYLAQLAMEEGGFTVSTASDGATALAAMRASAFDLVFLDVAMPGLSGFDVCRAIRSDPVNRRVPVVMTTGLDDDESIDRAYECGATDFVTKPINWTLLVHRARYVLRASRALDDVLENQRRLANAQRVAEIGDWEWDLATDLLRISEEAQRLLGLAPERPATTVQDLFAYCRSDERVRLLANLVDLRSGVEGVALDHTVEIPGQDIRHVHHLIEPVRDDASGTPQRIVGTVQDITRRKVAEDRIRRLAYVDALTGLPNRLSLTAILRSTIARAERSNRIFAVMFLDLDGFKRVNDTLGHDAGDSLLKAVATRLAHTLRGSDVIARSLDDPEAANVARLGGDEFVVVLPDVAGPESASAVAQRVIRALREPVYIENQDILVSGSVGIALYPADGETSDALLVSADAAMYHAKLSGRSQFQFFQPTMNAQAHDRLRLEAELRTALAIGELELWYQPRFGLTAGRYTGVEALLRWRHPTRGILSAGQFLDAARTGPLLAQIEDWVLAEASRFAARLSATLREPLPVSVNVSDTFLRRSDCVEAVERAAADAHIPAAMLELEFPAGSLLQQAELTVHTIHRLHEAGVRFAVDDFGVAYTSLPQLKRLPVGALKIDRTFVQNATVSADDAAIFHSIVGLANGLGLETIAEGVETAEQLGFLRSAGCHHCQGYLVSAPSGERDCIATLQQGGEFV